MFLCVSVNPAIDKRLRVTQLRVGGINRATEAIAEPGGKAAHVAMALRALGADPLWIGFAGCASGHDLVTGMTQLGIRTQPVPVRQPTRTNLALLDDSGGVTEILEPGGPPSAAELELFRNSCEQSFACANPEAIVILSGSLPPLTPGEFYAEMVEAARKHGLRVFVDTSGDALLAAIARRTDFVKPNREEAAAVTGRSVEDIPSAREAMDKIFSLGARSVALSLGKDGLLWCPGRDQPVLYARPPAILGRSAVGSGDAMVAGLAQATADRLTANQLARRAAACGTANCLVSSPGQIQLRDVLEIEKSVVVETLR